MELEERKQKEIEHSDRRRSIVRGYEYKTDASEQDADSSFVEDSEEYRKHFSNMKFYSVTRSSVARRDEVLYEGIEGKVVLDYCCGNGEIGIEMAKRGAADVYGIDISQVAIDNAAALAVDAGVGSSCKFAVMDAENTDFEGDTFDAIHEYGALHHLDLEAAFKELARILKPEGKLVCTETLRHNSFIHWYRHRTPHLRTEWEVEHILGVPEIWSGLAHFENVNIKFYHLAVLAAVPFRKSVIFRPLLAGLELIDKVLLSIPGLRRMAWVAVIVYSYPRKGG